MALSAALLSLAACNNRVISEVPWFGVDAGAGAPQLRAGLWRVDVTQKCEFDERQPLERWPNCAMGQVVRRDQRLTLSATREASTGRVTGYDWRTETYVLAAGDPRIVQTDGCVLDPMRKKADTSASQADATPASATTITVTMDAPATVEPAPESLPANPPSPPLYCYEGVRPTAWDSAGRITAYKTWPVACGPYPAEEASRRGKAADDDTVSAHPFPGLTIKDANCTADSLDALIAAARASENLHAPMADRHQPFAAHWDPSKIRLAPLAATAHWVRDAER